MLKDELTVLISTCDKNTDLLNPFFKCLKNNWSDNIFPVDIVTETKKIYLNDYKINEVHYCDNSSWCVRLEMALKNINTKYILLTLEDFFISDKISTQNIAYYLTIADKEKAGGIRIGKSLKPNIKINEEYGMFKRGEEYSVCAQVTIWNREYLLQILNQLGESTAWEFERYGNVIAKEIDMDIYSLYMQPYKYCELVAGGKWIKSSVKYCVKNKININLNARKFESTFKYNSRLFKGFIVRLNPKLTNYIVKKFNKNRNE